MYTVLVVIHVMVCVGLILIILLQAGKGADLGAMLGGAGSQTLFGGGGATTFLSKMTTVVAIVFMVTTLGLAYLTSHGNSVTGTVTEEGGLPEAVPGAVPAQPQDEDAAIPPVVPGDAENAPAGEEANAAADKPLSENLPAAEITEAPKDEEKPADKPADQ